MLEVWHIAVKLVGEDNPHIISVTSNTLKGAMSVAPQGLSYMLGSKDADGNHISARLNIEGLALVGIGRQ
jgi:hypothetical protein